MELSQFRRLIKEEVRKILKEETEELSTYVFELSGAKGSWGFDSKAITQAPTGVKHISTFEGNDDGGGHKLPQPVVVQRQEGMNRGYAYNLFVVATPTTLPQVLAKYVNANIKTFMDLSSKPVSISFPPTEMDKIKNKTIEALKNSTVTSVKDYVAQMQAKSRAEREAKAGRF